MMTNDRFLVTSYSSAGTNKPRPKLTGVSQAQRAAHRLSEGNSEPGGGASGAINVLAADTSELQRPQVRRADSAFILNVGYRGEVGATGQLLADHQVDERGGAGTVGGGVAFAASAFGMAGDHERRGRVPDARGDEQGGAEVLDLAQADAQELQPAVLAEGEAAQAVEGAEFQGG